MTGEVTIDEKLDMDMSKRDAILIDDIISSRRQHHQGGPRFSTRRA